MSILIALRWVGAAFIFVAAGLAEAQDAPRDWSEAAEIMRASMHDRMGEHAIPGGVLVIVRDGEIVLSEGFGVSDIATGASVNPATTRFRIASLTKPLTALAAGRLAEHGRLDLDVDIETYLGAETPNRRYDAPVTMRQLLTHTSGYDNTDIGDAARTRDDVVSLETYARNRMTAQTTAPGAHYRYANPGFALAGRVIERVSEEAYADHVAEAVFTPLGMTGSTLGQPEPGGAVEIATGHAGESAEQWVRLPYDYSQTPPADAWLATADDMAQFLLFQLGAHANGDAVISPQGLAETHAHQFGHTDGLTTMALGWERYFWRGRPILQHAGGQLGFTSYMAIVPEERVGFFIALNRRESAARRAVMLDMLDAYFPRPDYPTPQRVDSGRSLDAYAGRYRSFDFPQGDFQRAAVVLGMMGRSADVEAGEDALIINGARYIPIGPDRFQIDAGYADIRRFEFEDGAAQMLNGRDSYLRLAPLQSPTLITAFLLAGMAAAFGRGLVFPAYRLVRKGSPRKPTGAVAGRAITASNLVFLATMAMFAFLFMQDIDLDYGAPASVSCLLIGATLSVALVVVSGGLVLAGWALSYWGLVRRVVETLFAAIMLGAAWSLIELGMTLPQ